MSRTILLVNTQGSIKVRARLLECVYIKIYRTNNNGNNSF